MGFDLNKCYSHPGKLLKVHLENVASLSKRITSSDAAELVSLFLLPLHPGIKLGYLVNGC